jgi:hypothetical protein
MRIFLLLLLLLLTPVFVFANLQVENGKMSADLNSESLSNVLETLQQQTGMKVAIETEVGTQSISANFQNLPVAVGIKKLLEGTGINYVVIGDGQGVMSLFIGSSEKPGGAPRILDTRAPAMPGRGVVQPVNPMPPMPPPPQTAPATKTDNQKKGHPPPPVSVPTGGGFVPNNGNNNGQQQQQQVAPRPQIPPEEQTNEDDENDEQPQ